MHYAVGMCGAGAMAGTACVIARRGWRFIPAAMTAGGVWALIPDMPRVFREDFPNLPFAAVLGDKAVERGLHGIGDLFFFHTNLDAQPKEYALAGLAIILILYNLSIGLLMGLEWKQRNSIGNRSWRAHERHVRKRRRPRRAEAPPPPPQPDDPVIHRIEPQSFDQTG